MPQNNSEHIALAFAVQLLGVRANLVAIRKNGTIVHEVTVPWPDDDNPNLHLNDVMEKWEAELGEPMAGTYVISYEKI